MNRLTRSDTRAVSCAVQASGNMCDSSNAKPQHPRRGFTPVFHRVTGERDKFQHIG